MITYLLEVSLCWAGFYVLYALLLNRTTFFRTNRLYLLSTLVLGLILPLIPLPQGQEEAPVVMYFEPVAVTMQAVEVNVSNSVEKTGIDWVSILLAIYLLGVLLLGARLFFGLRRLFQIYGKGAKIQAEGYTLVLTREAALPFSFFGLVFWNPLMDREAEEGATILRHELAHIRERHSFDVLLTELLSIVFWCSPLIYFYRRSLRLLHEYLADAAVLRTTRRKTYGHLLLKQSQSGLSIALAHHFIHSQLKKRIHMMSRKTTHRLALLRYCLAAPLFVLFLVMFANRSLIAQTTVEIHHAGGKVEVHQLQDTKMLDQLVDVNQIESIEVLKNGELPKIIIRLKATVQGSSGIEYLQVVEEMPRFPGCEEEASMEARKACADKQMLMFFYKNIRYPASARIAGITGTVVVGFGVGPDGILRDARIIRSVSEELDQEVLRLVKLMDEQNLRWIPGRQKGIPVAVEIKIPIKFKLEGNTPAPAAEEAEKLPTTTHDKLVVVGYGQDASKAREEEVFKVVEEMPRFPGCENENLSLADKKNCADTKMLEYIYKNIRYPSSARSAGLEGTVVVSFIIGKDGKIRDGKVIRDIGGGLGEEALRVVNLMPERGLVWTPGRQRGREVAVQFNLPVKFVLPKEEPSAPATVGAAGQKLELGQFSLAPNPSQGQFRLRFQGEAQPLLVTIIDAAGKEVYRNQISNFDGAFDQTINLAGKAQGVLFVNIRQGEKIFSQQVMVTE